MPYNRHFGYKYSRFGEDTKGHEVKAFGNTTGKYFKWDPATNTFSVIGDIAQTGNQNITGALTASVSAAIGGGTAVTKIAVYAPSLTPTSVAAATTAEQTFTVTGLTTADKVIINGPAVTAGTGIVNARVSAANTLAITFANVTAGALTPAAGTYAVVAIRS